MDDCCGTNNDDHGHSHGKKRFDFILWGSTGIIALGLLLHFSGLNVPYAETFSHAILDLFSRMWWGIVLGMTLVGLMSKVPREYFNALLGRGDTVGGILRATAAGLLLDMCNHGILLVGAKLYERGASLGQVMAFLIASPWNSISLTIILISLIGLPWTLAFIAGSAVIAVITGCVYLLVVKKGWLPDNPNTVDLPLDFSIKADAKKRLKGFKPNAQFFKDIVINGWTEGRMLLRWLFLGIIIAAAIRTFMPTDVFTQWFGPSMFGLAMTLIATTIIEVCSEGSAPVASEILNRAGAPGNAFVFLMAGVSTDYTEMLILRETTKSWKIALSLPLITVPQVLLIGYLINIVQ